MSQAQQIHRSTAVLAPVDSVGLGALTVSRGFECYFDGDPEHIGSMLREIADTRGGRLSVAVGPGAEILGFLGVLPPRPGDRFYSVAPALEVVAFEVVGDLRGEGVFTTMFETLFRRDLEELVLYTIVDAALRAPGETPRSFRDRMMAVLGGLGFVPMPTDYERAHASRASAFLVRIGRGAATPEVEEFLTKLRAGVEASVAIAVREAPLRGLLRADLERGGFTVRSVASNGGDLDADVVVTDHEGPVGREVTVRLSADESETVQGSTIWFPVGRLDGLGDLLRRDLAHRRQGRG